MGTPILYIQTQNLYITQATADFNACEGGSFRKADNEEKNTSDEQDESDNDDIAEQSLEGWWDL